MKNGSLYLVWERGWSQIKPITFGNELRTFDMIPYGYSDQSK